MDFKRLEYPQKFEKLCKQIILFEYPEIKTVDGRGGDEGTDSFEGTISGQLAIFQFKYFPDALDSSKWKKIKESLKLSSIKQPRKWVLLVPTEFTVHDWKKWEEFKKEYPNIKLEAWTSSKLENTISKYKNRLIDSYPELFPQTSIAIEAIRLHREFIAEKSFLTIEDLQKKKDIEYILKYNKFVGRQAELNQLELFVKDQNKTILMIVGEGGVGKSRLTIEFARRLLKSDAGAESWNVFFINSQASFVPDSIEDRTLLILDESSRYNDFDRLIDFMTDPRKTVKLIVIDRPIFRWSIANHMREKFLSPQEMLISKGDIITFLVQHFDWIDPITVYEIDDKCKASFDYAIVYAEYAKEGKLIGEPREILSWKTAKYFHDIHKRTGFSIDDVTYALHFISLVTPINWPDSKSIFKDLISQHRYSMLESILEILMEEEQAVMTRHREFVIKPDALADFIRLQAFEDNRLGSMIDHLIMHFPYKIAYNFATLPSFYEEISDKVLQQLMKIWDVLNDKCIPNKEFVFALHFYSGNLSHLDKRVNFQKANPEHWLECYNQIPNNESNNSLRESLSYAISNVMNTLGKKGILDRIDTMLSQLTLLYEQHPDPNLRRSLLFALVNITADLAMFEGVQNITLYLDQIRRHYHLYPDETKLLLSKGLGNCIVNYRKTNDSARIVASLKELEQIYRNHNDWEIKLELCKALANSCSYYAEIDNFESMQQILGRLRQLYVDVPNVEIGRLLAFALLESNNRYIRNQLSQDMQSSLNELKAINQAFHDEEIAISFARALFNTVVGYIRKVALEETAKCITELELVCNHYDNNEIAVFLSMAYNNYIVIGSKHTSYSESEITLARLRQLLSKHPRLEIAINHANSLFSLSLRYTMDRKTTKMEDTLNELRKLYTKYHDSKILLQLCKSLRNASNHYRISSQTKKLSECIQEMRLFYLTEPNSLCSVYADALYNAIGPHLKYERLEIPEGYLDDLRKLYVTYENKEIRHNFAKALVDISIRYLELKKTADMKRCLVELEVIYDKYPENEIRIQLGKQLANVCTALSTEDQSDKIPMYLNKLRLLSREHSEVSDSLALASYSAVTAYGNANYFIEVEALLDELRSMSISHANLRITEALARSLANTCIAYQRSNQADTMRRHIIELESLYNQHTEIGEHLARALHYIIFYSGAKKNEYGDIMLLYKVRYCLPNELRDNDKIALIVNVAGNQVRTKLEESYSKGYGTLSDFLLNLKAVVSDSSDIVILLEFACQQLNKNIQTTVWKIIEEIE